MKSSSSKGWSDAAGFPAPMLIRTFAGFRGLLMGGRLPVRMDNALTKQALSCIRGGAHDEHSAMLFRTFAVYIKLCTQKIMEELLGRLNADFDESEGWIRIVDADWMADDLRLSLSVLFYEEAEPELWEVSCLGVVEESLNSEGVETLSISSESPLLKIFTEPEVELMFSENACVPAFLLGVVCTSCVEILGRAEYIQRFLNQTATVDGIVNSRYGQLGRFPESIAARIIEALNEKPIRVKALPGRIPKRWNGAEFVSYPVLKALEIGNSYVIAEKFSAVRA